MVDMHQLVAIFVIVSAQYSQTVHAQTSSVDGETCRRQCLGAFEFYRRFVVSTEFLDNYLSSCYSRCPASASTSISTSTSRPTSTSTSTSTSASTSTSTTTSTTTTKAPIPINSECGLPSLSSRFRIVGGVNASRCEFPWVVAISIDRNFCGGSIIGRRYILTAAHCLRDKTAARAVVSPSIVTVRVGSSNLYEMKIYQVQAVNINPNHVPVYNDYDVAVLTLTEDLVYSDCVAPICLPNVGEDAAQTEMCLAAGWGVTSFSSSSLSVDLQKVSLPIVSPALCNSSYGPTYINDLKLCAGNFDLGGIDSCQGDSGSPLMCYSRGRFFEYGIVSFGRSCAEPRYPGIYTKVSHPSILQFIKAIIG